MDENELKEIEDAYLHNKHVLQLVSEVRRLNEKIKQYDRALEELVKVTLM